MRARQSAAAIGLISAIVGSCAGSPNSGTETTGTAHPETSSTSTTGAPTSTTTTTLSFSQYPPLEVEAPGGRWRTTQLSIDTSVVGFVDLGGEGYMILRHPHHRVSAYRLVDDVWEAVRDDPVAPADLRRVRWGPIESDGERILLVANGRERGDPGGPQRRVAVVASTTDGDRYSTVTVPDAKFTDIATDGETWFAIGSSRKAGGESTGAIWSSTDGETWRAVFTSGQTDVEWMFNSIAVGGGRVVASGEFGQTQLFRSSMLLSSEIGGTWKLIPFGEDQRLTRALYAEDHFEVHTSLGRGYRSTDGVAWEPFVDEAAPPEAADVWGDQFQVLNFPLHAADLRNEGDVLIKSGESMHRTDWLHCYDDPTSCRRAFAAVWLRTDGEWSRVELPIPGPIQSADMSGGTRVWGADIVGGTIALVGQSVIPGPSWEDDGHWVWHWVPDDGASRPPPSAPLDTLPPWSDLAPRPRYSGQLGYYLGQLEPGVEYAIPLTDWCSGLDQLGLFNERFWVSDDMPVSIPPGWPKRWVQTAPYTDWQGPPLTEGIDGYRVLGVATLVSDDLIEYRIPAVGVVGTFHPGSPEPGC